MRKRERGKEGERRKERESESPSPIHITCWTRTGERFDPTLPQGPVATHLQ